MRALGILFPFLAHVPTGFGWLDRISMHTHTTNDKHGLLGLLILSKEETTKGVEAESSISAGYCSSEHLFLQNALQVV